MVAHKDGDPFHVPPAPDESGLAPADAEPFTVPPTDDGFEPVEPQPLPPADDEPWLLGAGSRPLRLPWGSWPAPTSPEPTGSEAAINSVPDELAGPPDGASLMSPAIDDGFDLVLPQPLPPADDALWLLLSGHKPKRLAAGTQL